MNTVTNFNCRARETLSVLSNGIVGYPVYIWGVLLSLLTLLFACGDKDTGKMLLLNQLQNHHPIQMIVWLGEIRRYGCDGFSEADGDCDDSTA